MQVENQQHTMNQIRQTLATVPPPPSVENLCRVPSRDSVSAYVSYPPRTFKS
jgi:hypothetical protein